MPKKGYKQTPEHIAKIREIIRNRPPMSDETKRKMSDARKGHVVTEETREKLRQAHLGKKHTPDHIENFKRSRKGYRPTQETKDKISKAQKGRVASPETRAKMSKAQKGRIVTDAMRKNMSKAHKGKPSTFKGKHHSEETKRKLGEMYRGDKCNFWKGGISFEPYCVKFNNEFKERVRDFFGRKCVECGKEENNNSGKKLSVHHVNYHKDACCNETIIPLFVPLCISCHAKTTHGDREYWEERYTNLINEKYNRQCYLPKNEYNPIKQEV